MKKVGILTYHRSINYGAVVQAYSLSKRLSEDFPKSKVEIIDYSTKSAESLYNKSIPNYIYLIKNAQELRSKAVYVKLLVNYVADKTFRKKLIRLSTTFKNQLKALPLSQEYIVTDDVDSFFLKISKQYDVVIVGSDTVWNWHIRKFPNAYFLNSELGAKKMSYAASSYGQDYLQATENQLSHVREAWNQYEYLGVRDCATEQFVKYADRNLIPHHNCDPTVFLKMEDIPVNIVDLEKKLVAVGVDLTKPIIGLMGKEWLGAELRRIIGKKYQVVSIFIDNPYADYYISDLAPLEWARIFSLFSVTFTHFFHGNLLSLKNYTPTIIIERKNSYNVKYNSKIRDFMKRISFMENCYYKEGVSEKHKAIMCSVDDMINNRASYEDRIKKGIAEEGMSYYDFSAALKKVLQEDA